MWVVWKYWAAQYYTIVDFSVLVFGVWSELGILFIRLLNLTAAQKLTSLTTACCFRFFALAYTQSHCQMSDGDETSQGKWKQNRKNTFSKQNLVKACAQEGWKHHLTGFPSCGVEGTCSPGLCRIINGVSETRQSPLPKGSLWERSRLCCLDKRKCCFFFFWWKVIRILKAKWWLESITEVLLIPWFLKAVFYFLFVSF